MPNVAVFCCTVGALPLEQSNFIVYHSLTCLSAAKSKFLKIIFFTKDKKTTREIL